MTRCSKTTPTPGRFRGESIAVGGTPLESTPGTQSLVTDRARESTHRASCRGDGSAIDPPLQVAGRASTPSGDVQVRVFTRGRRAPLGQGTIPTSRGSVSDPFNGEISWVNPGGGWGAVVVTSVDPTNDEVLQATAVPVGFIGGD